MILQLYNFKIHTIPFHSDTSTVSTDFILIGKQAQLEKKMNEEFIKNMKETYKLAYSMITSFPSFMDIMMKEYKKEKNKEKVIQIYQKQIQICECIENFAQACVSSKDNLSNFSKVIVLTVTKLQDCNLFPFTLDIKFPLKSPVISLYS